MKDCIVAVDQGTTSSKALAIDDLGRIISQSHRRYPIAACYPEPGWVEYDPEQILDSVVASSREAVERSSVEWSDVSGFGLANQGETVIAFDARDGRPLTPAISWEDRRSTSIVERWLEDGLETLVAKQTGLRLDPYFSAAKLRWILENCPEAQRLADAGRLHFGTSDAWLLWRLTGGERFITDIVTASRTMLLDLESGTWSERLAEAFGIPLTALPQIVDNAGELGMVDESHFGRRIPITGLCVDQQASLYGHGCHTQGEAKATYGTGCFLLANAGTDPTLRAGGLITSVGWRIGGRSFFAMEGGVYSAGSMIEWLIGIGLLRDAQEIDSLIADCNDSGGVYMIPAFSGLAAPHWQSRARAAWVGMNSGTDRAQLVRAAVVSIAYRVREIFDALQSSGLRTGRLRVDGGLSRCESLMQMQADVIDAPLERSVCPETTAYGVALLAGLGAGIWSDPQRSPRLDREAKIVHPDPKRQAAAETEYAAWTKAREEVARWGERSPGHRL